MPREAMGERAAASAATADGADRADGTRGTVDAPRASPGAVSEDLRERAHRSIPGGCHTFAKGDDQYPANAPAFIRRGHGCRIEDVEGREYIEYAMGLRSVTLGHAWPSVVDAAARAMRLGTNFNRPHELEVAAAERFLELVPSADMVKFTKDGSSVMTAAVKLARAATGRELVALCADSPFFSYDDWFIGTTAIDAGIPGTVKPLSLGFRYNDVGSLETLFAAHPGRIACVCLEPARLEEPAPGFLERVRAVCDREGAVMVFDETLTGFRFHRHGAQHLYGVTPDLSCFGKAMANGFSVSALAGRRELMELGGLRQTEADRVFLLSTTHGAESGGLAAAVETMRIYRDEPVVEHLHAVGERLREGFWREAERAGVTAHVSLEGRGCNLTHGVTGPDGEPSQAYRTLFLQELCREGVLAPTFYTSYSHHDHDIDRTVEALARAFDRHATALRIGAEPLLEGPPTASAYRKRNGPR